MCMLVMCLCNKHFIIPTKHRIATELGDFILQTSKLALHISTQNVTNLVKKRKLFKFPPTNSRSSTFKNEYHLQCMNILFYLKLGAYRIIALLGVLSVSNMNSNRHVQVLKYTPFLYHFYINLKSIITQDHNNILQSNILISHIVITSEMTVTLELIHFLHNRIIHPLGVCTIVKRRIYIY